MTAMLSIVTRQPRQPAKLVTANSWDEVRFEKQHSRQTLARWRESGDISGAVTPEEWRIAAYGR